MSIAISNIILIMDFRETLMRLFALFIFSVASGAGLGFSATDVDNCESLECLSDIVSNGRVHTPVQVVTV